MYHYDVEGRLIAESNPNGAMQKRYIWLDGELIGVLAGDELFFVHANYRNEPWLVTGPSGAVIWQNLTAPFGNSAETYPKVAESHPGFTLNLRLSGQYYDAETGYHYNYMRDYSPELGRYLQADPIGLKGGMNLYAYCSGDPVNRRDELGLWVVEFELGGSVFLGTVGIGGDVVSVQIGTQDGDIEFNVDGLSLEVNSAAAGIGVGKGSSASFYSGDISDFKTASSLGLTTPFGTGGVINNPLTGGWGLTYAGPTFGAALHHKSPEKSTEIGNVPNFSSEGLTPGG